VDRVHAILLGDGDDLIDVFSLAMEMICSTSR